MTLQPKQTAQQRLMLAPNVTLALEILRMPTTELQAFLRQQAEENPLLELEESDQDELETAPADADGQETADAPRLDEEWLSHWQTEAAEADPDGDDAAEGRLLAQQLVKPQSLHESLSLQLGCQKPSQQEEQRLGEALIANLDEYGYLDGSLEELAAQVGAPREQLEAILKIIQRFDPPGVGARDLRECLMIQLEHDGACENLPAPQPATSDSARQAGLAYRILQDHFPLFVQQRLSAIAAATGASLQQVAEACECLKRLNPKPGRLFTSDLPPSIVPDLIIHQRERHYDVELNDQDMPQVGMSSSYFRMLKDPRTPDDAKEFLLKKFRQASWIIKAIDERNATLLSIGRCLISLQRDFVEQGPRALKPLTQAQVARLIGRHASTVSRAIASKTIDTPYGVFRLEQLFASGVHQAAESGEVSDATIKAEIQHLIDEEDGLHPLSDETLTQRLMQRSNISVARRTIAKYRTSLKILPAHLRKRRLT